MSYPGITSEALYLLAENRFHDSKAFYEEHKEEIRRRVVFPLRELCAELAPTVLAIDEKIIVEPNRNGCVSRVRRDTRFSKDKMLYRENMWVAFQRDKTQWDGCLPAFYMDFSVNRTDWGLGFYSATPVVMQALRLAASAQPKRFLQAVKSAEKAGFFLSGQAYAKPRHPENAPEKLWPFYDLRSVDLNRREAPSFVTAPGLPETLKAGFTALAPLYGLLTEAMEIAGGYRMIPAKE